MVLTMSYISIPKLLLLLLSGVSMLAQTNLAPDEKRIMFYDRAAGVYRLENNAFFVSDKPKDVNFDPKPIKYFIDGKEHGKLSQEENNQFEATPRVTYRNRRLCLDGKRVRQTTSPCFLRRVFRVHAAFHIFPVGCPGGEAHCYG